MNYLSILVGWFLEYFTSEEINMLHLLQTLALAMLNGGYLFFVYRSLTRKTFYTKRYNVTISGVCVITAAIIYTVQFSIVLSLGVVGALAVVRFRTALKDPLDIMFLFWAVVTGVCYGGQMAEIAIILSSILTLLILYLEEKSVRTRYSLLILECNENSCNKKIRSRVYEECKKIKLRQGNWDNVNEKLVIEALVKNELHLLLKLKEIPGIESVSLIAHCGEHNY